LLRGGVISPGNYCNFIYLQCRSQRTQLGSHLRAGAYQCALASRVQPH
jgi:hypothetical protein